MVSRWPLLFLLLPWPLAGAACEQHFSATPATLPESADASASGGLDALLRQSAGDAGPSAPATSHAMRITSCDAAPDACASPARDASTDGSYRVVSGSGGGGAIRSREQALTDLYREMRDRIDAGDRLAVHVLPPGDGGTAAAWHGRAATPTTPSSDALAQSAMQLLDALDGEGELVVDVIHNSRSNCVLSLAHGWSDAGVAQCLIQAPERSRTRGRGGLSF